MDLRIYLSNLVNPSTEDSAGGGGQVSTKTIKSNLHKKEYPIMYVEHDLKKLNEVDMLYFCSVE